MREGGRTSLKFVFERLSVLVSVANIEHLKIVYLGLN